MPLKRSEFRKRLYTALSELATIVEHPEMADSAPEVAVVYPHTDSRLEDGATLLGDRDKTAAPRRTLEILPPLSAGPTA